jgi:NADH pyrophosphatase NudC (nudix superfamily)
MKHLLFAGQDIFVDRGPVLDLSSEAVDAVAAAAAIGRRDFEEEGMRYAAWMLDDHEAEAALGPALRRITIRDALAEFPAAAMRPVLRGIALLRWLEIARFCGACGSPLADKDMGSEDSGGRFCTSCGRVHFPRISPAVIVLIRKGPRALLAHNARFRNGFFGLIAGFVEAGETLEDAAAREAREEAGIEICDLRYVKSQPWPFPDSLGGFQGRVGIGRGETRRCRDIGVALVPAERAPQCASQGERCALPARRFRQGELAGARERRPEPSLDAQKQESHRQGRSGDDDRPGQEQKAAEMHREDAIDGEARKGAAE